MISQEAGEQFSSDLGGWGSVVHETSTLSLWPFQMTDFWV